MIICMYCTHQWLREKEIDVGNTVGQQASTTEQKIHGDAMWNIRRGQWFQDLISNTGSQRQLHPKKGGLGFDSR